MQLQSKIFEDCLTRALSTYIPTYAQPCLDDLVSKELESASSHLIEDTLRAYLTQLCKDWLRRLILQRLKCIKQSYLKHWVTKRASYIAESAVDWHLRRKVAKTLKQCYLAYQREQSALKI